MVESQDGDRLRPVWWREQEHRGGMEGRLSNNLWKDQRHDWQLASISSILEMLDRNGAPRLRASGLYSSSIAGVRTIRSARNPTAQFAHKPQHSLTGRDVPPGRRGVRPALGYGRLQSLRLAVPHSDKCFGHKPRPIDTDAARSAPIDQVLWRP
jgi:hypothetical protein